MLKVTPQGRRLGYHAPEQVSNQEPPDPRPSVLTTTLLGGVYESGAAAAATRIGASETSVAAAAEAVAPLRQRRLRPWRHCKFSIASRFRISFGFWRLSPWRRGRGPEVALHVRGSAQTRHGAAVGKFPAGPLRSTRYHCAPHGTTALHTVPLRSPSIVCLNPCLFTLLY